ARVTDGAAAVSIVGTPGTGAAGGAAPVTLRIHGREVGRALAVPGSTVSITLPPLGPGWWVGDVVLDADELRADDTRLLVWRVAAPARVAGLSAAAGDVGGGTGADTTVLATVNGQPWLVRDGNVLLVGGRLDTAWTALPAAPAFVPFVDALVDRLARGEALISEVEGVPRVEFRTRGADTIGAIVYGLDPQESDLTPAPPALVHDVLEAEVLDGAAFAAARFAGAGRRDGSGLLLMLALVCALVELGVATRTR